MEAREKEKGDKREQREKDERKDQAERWQGNQGNPDRMGGGPKKEGQVPYGSTPPERERKLDEGREAGMGGQHQNTPRSPQDPSRQEMGDRSKDQDEEGPGGTSSMDDKNRNKKPLDNREDHRSSSGT